MTEVEAAWLAGLIDGEGCISLFRFKPYKSNKTYTYRIGLQIAMCHYATIKKVQSITGIGTITHETGKKDAYNDTYRWALRSKSAYLVLKSVYPYLVTKSDQAKIAIEFHEHKKPRIGRGGLCEEEIALRAEYYRRFSLARKDGVGKTNLHAAQNSIIEK